MEKRPEKIIPWRRHNLRLDVAVRKEKSPCRHAEKVVDVVVVAPHLRQSCHGENESVGVSDRGGSSTNE